MRVEMVKINSEKPEPSLVRYAADQIRAGEVLGMPTDTFYGLAADPFNLRAVERVYEIKSRSRHKPLSLLIEDVDQAEELAKPLPEEFHALAKKFWPGPLTIIVKAASRLPLKVTANTGNVALRVPNAQIPLAVLKAAQIPITATSANLSGETECTTWQSATSLAHAFRSSWMVEFLPAKLPRPLSTLQTKKRGGRFCARAQSRRRRFRNFSRRGDRDASDRQSHSLALVDGSGCGSISSNFLRADIPFHRSRFS